MRVIAGTARGVRLASPKGKEVRPTLDRVRESVFNIIAPRLEGSRFLDGFAGTGANGIEALSRGAADAVFVESAPHAIRLIEENLKRARCERLGTVLRATLPKDFATLKSALGTRDVIYLDPPYGFTQHSELLEKIDAAGVLAADGLVIVEHHKNVALGHDEVRFRLSRQKHFGNTAVSFFTC